MAKVVSPEGAKFVRDDPCQAPIPSNHALMIHIGSAKALVFALLVVLFSPATYATVDRQLIPSNILITLNSKNHIDVKYDKLGGISEINVILSETTYGVPTKVCSAIKSMQVDTIKLKWAVHVEMPQDAQFFFITFRGQLNFNNATDITDIILTFEDGKFSDAAIKSTAGEYSVWYTDK